MEKYGFRDEDMLLLRISKYEHQSIRNSSLGISPPKHRRPTSARWHCDDDTFNTATLDSNEKDSGIGRTDDSAKNDDSSSDFDNAEMDHSTNQKQHLPGVRREVIGNRYSARELRSSADVSMRSNGRTMYEYSPSHRALYDNSRDQDVIALGRRISQVRLSSQYDHQASTSGQLGASPTFGRPISSPARRRVAECRAMDERMASESLSPTRRIPRMGTKSERPCSWSPGRILSSFIAAIVPDVPSVSSPRRVAQPAVNEQVSRSHRNSPSSSQHTKCREAVNVNRPADEQPIRYADHRDQTSNNWRNGRTPTQSSPARNDLLYSGFNKITGSPDTRNHRAMRYELSSGETKWRNIESNNIVNCVNDARYRFQESIGMKSGSVQLPASQLELTASHLRQEVDRIHQLRHQQTNNSRSVTPVHDALRDAQGDWSHQTIHDQQQRRCSRHDDFQRACAQKRDDSSPAKLKRDREFQPPSKTNNNTVNSNANAQYPTTGGGRSQETRTVCNNPLQMAPTKCDPILMPPPPSPAQSDWVIRRRADGSRYVTKRRHSARDRILRERERRLAEERRSTTTTTTTEEEEAAGDVGLRWPKSGHYCTRDARRTQLVASRERKSRRQKALLQRLYEEQRKQHQLPYEAVSQQQQYSQQSPVWGVISQSNV